MMTYTAPDGYVIESKPYPEIVTYTCPCQGIVDGRYFLQETTGDSTIIGIQQINVKLFVANNTMTIEIKMSSDQELIDYINQVSS